MDPFLQASTKTYDASMMCDSPANDWGWREPGLLHTAVMEKSVTNLSFLHAMMDSCTPQLDSWAEVLLHLWGLLWLEFREIVQGSSSIKHGRHYKYHRLWRSVLFLFLICYIHPIHGLIIFTLST